MSLRVDVINAAPILWLNHAAMHANALMTARSFNIRFASIHGFSLLFFNSSDEYLLFRIERIEVIERIVWKISFLIDKVKLTRSKLDHFLAIVLFKFLI